MEKIINIAELKTLKRQDGFITTFQDAPFTGEAASNFEEVKIEETEYLNGKKNGKRYSWHWDGSLAMEENYKDGKLNGKSITWNQKDVKHTESNYSEGKLDGISSQWRDNGTIRYQENYKNDLKEGKSHYWYSNGKLETEELWVNNELISRRCWDESGNSTNCPSATGLYAP